MSSITPELAQNILKIASHVHHKGLPFEGRSYVDGSQRGLVCADDRRLDLENITLELHCGIKNWESGQLSYALIAREWTITWYSNDVPHNVDDYWHAHDNFESFTWLFVAGNFNKMIRDLVIIRLFTDAIDVK